MNKTITRVGFELIKAELDDLRRNKRHEVAEKIRVARGFGDLSENSEYDAAKNEQAMIEAKIAELQRQLQDVTLIEEEDISTNEIAIGTTVTLYDISYDEELSYRLVSDLESQHATDETITDSSPVGMAIQGAKIGDIVNVHLPNGGTGAYKVLAIN